MQPNYVLAFRKRLYNRGYRDIKIYRVKCSQDVLYNVSACEPLAGVYVSRNCDIDYLLNSFR